MQALLYATGNIAGFHERGEPSAAHLSNVWQDFSEWYSKRHEQA